MAASDRPAPVPAHHDEALVKNVQRHWIAIGLTVVALVAVGIYVLTRPSGQEKDCATVAALNNYNKQFHDEVASPEHGPTDVGEYRQWAGELHRYAADINNPTLRAKADTVTGLADQYVALLPALQADLPPDNATQLPASAPWQEGSRIGGQFNGAVLALAQACPR